MRSDLEQMHRAILLDPSDDVARLAYADALEETGKQDHARKAKVIRDGLRLRGMAYHTSEHWVFVKKVSALDYLRKPALPSNDARPISADLTVSRGLPFKWQCTLEDFMDGAAMLFSAHPITQVDLTDRTPRSDFHGFNWFRLSGLPRDSRLPDELFDLLQGGTLGRVGLPYATYRWYPSADDATDSLSTACVAQGRSLAGLPPLPV